MSLVLVVMTHLLGIFLRDRGAPFSVHRQSGGHSCFMTLHLADPQSRAGSTVERLCSQLRLQSSP